MQLLGTLWVQLVSSTTPTILVWSFWNFADGLTMIWERVCGLDIIVIFF